MDFFKKTVGIKRFFLIVFCGIFLSVFSGCGSDTEKTTETNLENSATLFEIPEDWRVFSAEEIGNANIIFSAREPSQVNEMGTVLAVYVGEKTTLSLDELSNGSLEQIRQQSQNFEKISEEWLNLKNTPAKLVFYKDKYSGNGKKLGFYSLYSIGKTKTFISTLAFDDATSEDHKTFLKNIMLSFSIPESEKITETTEEKK